MVLVRHMDFFSGDILLWGYSREEERKGIDDLWLGFRGAMPSRSRSRVFGEGGGV